MKMYLKYNKISCIIYNTENYKPLELKEQIEDFLYTCIGGRTYQVDIGSNRDPEYITKKRHIKKKHWDKLKWGTNENNICFSFDDETLSYFTIKENHKIYPKIIL